MKDLEARAEAILRAAGSSLKYFVPGTREAILAAVRDAMGEWQPMENAPKNGGRFIAAFICQSSKVWCVEADVAWHKDHWCSDGAGWIEPTHWRPLPLPPAP